MATKTVTPKVDTGVEEVVPKHLGLILDGNRRWARSQGLPVYKGHLQGYKNLKTICDAARDMGVTYISVYIFSTENWQRASEEVEYIMGLAMRMVKNDLKGLHKKNIQVRWLGVPDRVSPDLVKAIRHAEEVTKDNTGGVFALCFNYGGQLEIADAMRSMIKKGIAAEDITPEIIQQHLYGPDIPDVDLVIRTSGEERISNFMLWRCAYAEFYFSQKNWPAFTVDDLGVALKDYARRQRRMGA